MAPVTRRSPDGSSGRTSKHATATALRRNTSTKKLENRCHAGIVVTQVHTGGYEAIICRNHGGHVPRDDPRSQLPLSQACRTFIENELAAGLPRSLVLQRFDALAHDVRHRASSLSCLFSGRDLGLSAKDVANVEAELLGLRSYGLRGGCKDRASVAPCPDRKTSLAPCPRQQQQVTQVVGS